MSPSSRHRYRALAGGAALAAGLAATAPASAEPPDHAGRSPKHVVLIDWDGFDPAFLEMADTPNLDALAARGSLSTGSSTFQTMSNPARTSMSTGAWPDTHENAAYYFDEDTDKAKGHSATSPRPCREKWTPLEHPRHGSRATRGHLRGAGADRPSLHSGDIHWPCPGP